MKINIGQLVSDTYSQDEVIGWLAEAMLGISNDLSKGIAANNMGVVGATAARIVDCTGVLRALDEKVNGKKERTVI